MPEYVYFDVPREFPSYVFSWRPPYVRRRSRDPISLAKRLAELMEERLVISSRELSSGTLYAEGLKVRYEYSEGLLRRTSVEYSEEPDEPYAIERGRKVLRPLSLLLLDYDAVIIRIAKSDAFRLERKPYAPMPGTLVASGDPIETIPITTP